VPARDCPLATPRPALLLLEMGDPVDPTFDVELYVYDLSRGMASAMSMSLLGKQIEGIWHSSVVVYGVEYYFGAGIMRDLPGQTMHGTPKEKIALGKTGIPQDVFEEFLSEISPNWTPAKYSLLRNNCNNFSDEVSQFLTGNPIPTRITGLPTEVLSTPMGAMFGQMIEQMETTQRSAHGGSMFDPSSGGRLPMRTASQTPVHPRASVPGLTPATAAPAAQATPASGPGSAAAAAALARASTLRTPSLNPAGATDTPASAMAPQSATSGSVPKAPVKTNSTARAAPTPVPMAERGVADPVARDATAKKVAAQEEFKKLVQQEFARLTTEMSLPPNEAAALAIKNVRAKIAST